MNLTKIIESQRPCDIAIVRGKAQNHSSDEKKSLLKKAKEIEQLFEGLGFKIVVVKNDNKDSE